MMPDDSQPWSLPFEELAQKQKTDVQQGLTTAEAEARLLHHGPNQVTEGRRWGAVTLFLRQFADLMVGILAIAAIISGLIGDWADTILIGLIVIANAIVGFAQEWKADRALDALKSFSHPTARVRRNGTLQVVAVETLTPGDVIEVKAGDLVPADARLISAAAMEADESPLTGESLPVVKTPEPVAADSALPDRTCMLFSGTTVVHGHGAAIIVATGGTTELGQIAELLETSDASATPLQSRLAGMNRIIAAAVVVVSLLIFLVGVFREPSASRNWQLVTSMLLTAVSLAVAAIPEGLPAVITVTLALGSQRMSRRHAIIRKLAAVEALGSVDVICSDKTGTLTQNRMQVADLIPAESIGLPQLLEAVVLCSDARAGHDGQVIGSATEAAILTAAMEKGVEIDAVRGQHPRVAEVPFSSEQKQMTTVHQREEGGHQLIVKGAAEGVLPLCRFASDDEQQRWTRRIDELAHDGHRMLAVAQQTVAEASSLHHEEIAPASLQLLGLIGLVDPVRPEAREAIALCKSAGIRALMITGDHPGTAAAIASQLGMFDTETKLMTGRELEKLSDEELDSRIDATYGFARVSPQHKLRIVKALQARNHLVAMTGDGVNDAPALRQADVGVAMGITGTDVSRQSAEIVLTDDNFATIVAAVEEGRIVYDNIRKFIAYLLTANMSEVLVLLGAILLGLPLPLLPIHLLWINLVTDSLPALALGFEKGELDVMARKPRRRDESLFSHGLGVGIVVMGIITAIVSLGIFLFELQGTETHDLNHARTMTFLVLSVSQLFYVLGVRSFTTSIFHDGLWANWRLAGAVVGGIALQIGLLYVPVLRPFFHTVPLSLPDLGLGLLVSLIPFLLVEGWKAAYRIKKTT